LGRVGSIAWVEENQHEREYREVRADQGDGAVQVRCNEVDIDPRLISSRGRILSLPSVFSYWAARYYSGHRSLRNDAAPILPKYE